MVAHACNPSYTEGIGRRITVFKASLGKKCKTLSEKQPNAKRAGGV
jgi:hypothetical protein